ncbi:MAG: hypothetical protein JWR36_2307 [Glaciihabitans sp.]|nr:hypothetical protein [Glaciihabitans sp.]MDQ1570577.1 hypothetical protein [Actinomycetota bacterium]
MTSSSPRHVAPRAAQRRDRAPHGVKKSFASVAALVAFAMTAIFAVAPPPPPASAYQFEAYVSAHPQSLTVSTTVAGASLKRDIYSSTPALQALSANATNYDWAKLVLVTGGWPMSHANVTVFVRWMRQENGPNNWWNRNNPLNNGWGSGGGAGLGSYPNLLVAAKNAAAALHGNPGYSAIVAALAASAPTTVTEKAIWASPWSSSHYANGTHWAYTPVPAFTAPASAW